MTLEDYARAYTFRAASLTMARFISPRLGWRVRDAANSNSRVSLPTQAGGAALSFGTPTPVLNLAPFHEAPYAL